MPALQVVDLTNDAPKQNYVGEFARSFGETLNKNREKKSDEDIFARIKQQYPNATPTELYEKLSVEPGLTEPYRKDTLGFLNSYISNKSKEDELAIRRETNRINDIRATNQANNVNNTTKNQPHKQAALAADYNRKILKGSGEDLNTEDIQTFNNLTSKLMASNVPLDQASATAYQQLGEIKEALKSDFAKKLKENNSYTVKSWNTTAEQVTEAENNAYEQGRSLYDLGVPESTLRKKYKDADWTKDDIDRFLRLIKQAPSIVEQQVQESQQAQEQQGQQMQQPPVDDILFGG